MHTVENNVVKKVRSELDSVMKTVDTTVQDAMLTAIESLVNPRVERARKSINAATERGVSGVVLDLDQRDFSEHIEGLQKTAANRMNSHIDLNKFEETRG